MGTLAAWATALALVLLTGCGGGATSPTANIVSFPGTWAFTTEITNAPALGNCVENGQLFLHGSAPALTGTFGYTWVCDELGQGEEGGPFAAVTAAGNTLSFSFVLADWPGAHCNATGTATPKGETSAQETSPAAQDRIDGQMTCVLPATFGGVTKDYTFIGPWSAARQS
jgi:hypothetical protein